MIQCDLAPPQPAAQLAPWQLSVHPDFVQFASVLHRPLSPLVPTIPSNKIESSSAKTVISRPSTNYFSSSVPFIFCFVCC